MAQALALTALERQFILEAIESWDQNQFTSLATYEQRDALEASIIEKLSLEEVRDVRLA